MRIAVVGGGPWARDTHIPALAAHPGVTLTGVWTRRPEAATDLPVPRFDTFAELLAANDAVSFAVPPQAQAPLAIEAARAGKHVILDKPIAGTLADATAVVDAVAGAGVRSIVTFTRRFAPETRAFLDAVDAGTFTGGLGVWLSGALLGGRYSSSQWRVDGGALLDVGPHVVDLMDRALGPVVDVEAASVDRGSDVWSVSLVHESGARTAMQLSLRVPARPTISQFRVHGPDGVVELTDRTTPSPECFAVLVDEFLDAVATGTDHPCDARRGLHIQTVLDRIAHAVS
ncbi:Gfo/Idh/MocA family oxidoreductase [Williamsia herbipolensis]|uniref:Gfo/Idh/MocA family oxidoreductase n=1 Tax=Williamsia herbipolensis TaxID=1603258 RepID=A0AAU4JZB2_9NOCA|nr:Gfo/Idh/MocA family oxidoreductase [Williamsia herbipolensis]